MEWHEIDCGSGTLHIQVFDSGAAHVPGPTVVVTAGMDGDEYVGMKAAQSLVKAFTRVKPRMGRIVILPCVNTPGFAAKMSVNPQDMKYPKFIYPGNPKGSETERLVAWIASHYIYEADYWLDLHGGATNESLTPFVWAYQIKNSRINEMTTRVLSAIRAPITVYQKNFGWGKVEKLAQTGCSYCICECGDKGKVRKKDIALSLSWVTRVLADIGMIQVEDEDQHGGSEYFSEVHEYKNPKNNWGWFPSVTSGEVVIRSQVLGEVRDMESISVIQIRARQMGKILWHMVEGPHAKHDVLVAIGAP
jgi:predicted deacylase